MARTDDETPQDGEGSSPAAIGIPRARTAWHWFDFTCPFCYVAERFGRAELLKACTLPLTGAGVVDLVITDLGVFSIDKKGGTGMTLIELADGVTVDEIEAKTQADFKVAFNSKQPNTAEASALLSISGR
jgi:hypothetical protein